MRHKNKYRVISEIEVQDLMYRLEVAFFDQSLFIEDDYRTVQEYDSEEDSFQCNTKPQKLFYFEVVRKVETNAYKRRKNQVTHNELFQKISQKIYHKIFAEYLKEK